MIDLGFYVWFVFCLCGLACCLCGLGVLFVCFLSVEFVMCYL